MAPQLDNLKKLFNRKKQVTAEQTVQQQKNVSKKTASKLKGFSLKKTKTTPLSAQIDEPIISKEEESLPISNFEVIQNYPINPPFSYINIIKYIDRGNITYTVDEPKLTENDQFNLQRLKGILNEVLNLKASEMQSKDAAGQYLINKSKEIMETYDFKLDIETQSKLLYYIVRDNLGFGKIDALMNDQLIEDISCDGVNVPLYIWHRKF
jgi:archaeal flagellar protein FlaI